MSNDRHTRDTRDIARTMAAAAAREPGEPATQDIRRDGERVVADERAAIDDRAAIDHRTTSEDRPSAIFAQPEAGGYRTQWDAIQTGFVDEPRKAVQEADALVSLVTKRLAEVFTDERNALEHQWDRGDEISTEDLRLALRKYHAFFERLLRL